MPFWKVKFCWSAICTTGGTHPFLYLYFGNFSNYSFLYENNNSFNNNNNNDDDLTMNNKQRRQQGGSSKSKTCEDSVQPV